MTNQPTMNHTEINQTEIKTVNSLLDQVIKLADPKTVRFLKRAQTALKEGHLDKAKTEIIRAFDGLSDTDQMGNLNQSQLKSIEQMISRLYRQPQSTNQKVQSEIDRLLNRSYQASQRGGAQRQGLVGGSQLSYLYLLMALDRAGIPIENTPRHFQKQVKTWLNSINKDAVQIGGALPIVSALPALSVSPLAYLGSGLGLLLLTSFLIALLFINRNCQKSLKQQTAREMHQIPLSRIPSVYGSERPGSIYGVMPQRPPYAVAPTYADQPAVPVQYGIPPSATYGQAAQAESEYGQLNIMDNPVNIPGVGEYDVVPPQQMYAVTPYVYDTMPLGGE